MTEQDARKIIGEITLDRVSGEELEAINIAVKALEKQIPKKPIGNSCPICGADFCSESWERDYCCLCGQKLKWGDEE